MALGFLCPQLFGRSRIWNGDTDNRTSTPESDSTGFAMQAAVAGGQFFLSQFYATCVNTGVCLHSKCR